MPPPHLPTRSLRTRVVAYSLVVVGLVLVVVSLLAGVFVGIQSRADLRTRLSERADLADQLAAQHVPPDELVDRVSAAAIRARLVTPNGSVYGIRRPPDPDTAPNRPGHDRVRGPSAQPEIETPPGRPVPQPGGAAHIPTQPGGAAHIPTQPGGAGRLPAAPPRFSHGPVVRRTLVDGSRLTLFGDSKEVTLIQRRLRNLLMTLAVGGLALAGIALLVTTRVALRPLDSMTTLARSIAAGDRGRRLSPTRPDTELGRTASAFDDMLDALEGAERSARTAETEARDSESRTRQFVADAAHELRTPVAGLRAAAEALASPRAAGEERDRLLLLLIREAGRAGRLVEELLALARIDAGLRLVREPVDLLSLAESEADRVRLLSPGQSVCVGGDRVTVSADPQRLAQVLTNLLDNARRYVPEDGAITVTVDSPDPMTGRIRVADNGPGVPLEDRERIFDRLVRLDESRSRVPHDQSSGPGQPSGGAGLGLAIARGIARAHGGELRCGDESVFELIVPTTPSEPGPDQV
jgi:signal transduction histidine kinase